MKKVQGIKENKIGKPNSSWMLVTKTQDVRGGQKHHRIYCSCPSSIFFCLPVTGVDLEGKRAFTWHSSHVRNRTAQFCLLAEMLHLGAAKQPRGPSYI